MVFHEYSVVGRPKPTADRPNPRIYRMRLFARSPETAQGKFWYYLGKTYKLKRANGEVLAVNEIFEKRPTQIKNFGIILKYSNKTGTINQYKEYRDVTRVGAIEQLYNDMAGRYRARFRNVHVISVDTIPAAAARRANTKQFHDRKISFPLPHRRVRAPTRAANAKFLAKRPTTHF
jgi:large subunit ribosomal protein L18Ae